MSQLSAWAQADAPHEQKENLLQLIRKVLKVDTRYVADHPKLFPLFKDAFIAFLSRAIPLSFKVCPSLFLMISILTMVHACTE